MTYRGVIVKKFLVAAFAFAIALVSVSFAASPYFFKGYAHVNGSLAPNGTIVEVFLNGTGTVLGSAIVGEGSLGGTPQGWYTVGFEGNSENIVSFRVNNLTLISANGTNVTAQTLGSSVIHENFNLSVNKSSNGAACLYAIGCSSGFCTDSYCCNSACGGASEDCNVAGALGTCTSTASTSTSTGSSGGGSSGGGGGAESTTSETITLPSVGAGSVAVVDISSSVSANIGIEEIQFNSAVSASNVQVTVKETTRSAAGVTAAISSSEGAVYKYLEITKTNIQDASISSAKISFKVPKTWLTANDIDKSTVTLNRFSNNAWSSLPTTITTEDANYVYYSATSAGFSVFAITGKKVSAEPAPEQPPVQPEQPAQPGQPTTQEPPPSQTPASDMNYVYLGILAVLIIGAVAYFVMKRPKNHYAYHSS